MFEVAWKEITAKGRIVCKRRAFKSDTARETYIDRLIQKDSFYEIIGIRDPLWSRERPAARCEWTQEVILTFQPDRVMNGMLPAGAGSEIQQEVHTMTHEEMLREYTRSYKNMLSASAQRRLEELEAEAAREGLRFQMVNEAQWMLPHFIGDPRFELIPA